MPPALPERVPDVRFIGAVMGRYTLESRRDHVPGAQRVFACRLQSISAHMIVASAPVAGRMREGVTAHFEPFGTLGGSIVRHVDGGFCIDIDCTHEERQKLASKIDWYKKRTFAGITDKREHKRSMPREPRSAVMLADGRALACLVIDMSVSGAAVSADIDPKIGEPLAIGKVVGRVVRKLDVGFAVQFIRPVDAETLEDSLRAPEEWERLRRAASEAELMAEATAADESFAI